MFENLFNSITEISATKQYWFVRTDSGQHFESFYHNNFIGIGWDEITVNDLHTKSEKEVKDKIATIEKLDPTIKKSKGKITAIYNKLKRFDELKKGDLVIIPSRSSSRLAFGIIESTPTYVENERKDNCHYRKRKAVKWIETRTLSTLDPIFYKIVVSRHAISNIKGYQSYIENTTNNLYIQGDAGHFVFDVKTKKDINVDSLISFIEALRKLTNDINLAFEFEEDLTKSAIKLNIQSPGIIDYIVPKGKSLMVLAAVLALTSGCSIDSQKLSTQELQDVDTIIRVNRDTIDVIHKEISRLEMDQNKINSIY